MKLFIEKTPNPNILKFVFPTTLTKDSFEYSSVLEAEKSPIAVRLLQFPFIEKVYISGKFIALQKTESTDWELVVDELKNLMNDAYENNEILKSDSKKLPFSLYAEVTPNPNSMKFVANKLLVEGMYEIKRNEDSTEAPIAKDLFQQFPFIQEIFISDNYLSVTKDSSTEWQEQSIPVKDHLLQYLQKGGLVVTDQFKPNVETASTVEKKRTPIEEKIASILEEYIKPAVASDGGNIELVEFDESTKTAVMLLQGACSGCPSSTVTLKNGIETMLKNMLPGEVESVTAING